MPAGLLRHRAEASLGTRWDSLSPAGALAAAGSKEIQRLGRGQHGTEEDEHEVLSNGPLGSVPGQGSCLCPGPDPRPGLLLCTGDCVLFSGVGGQCRAPRHLE